MSEHENERVVVGGAIVRAWRDEAYRRQLLGDPATVLREAGLELPAGCRVTVLEDTDAVAHVAVPRAEDLTAGQKERFAAELAAQLPLPAGREVRLRQNTDEELFLVLPLPPAPMDELDDEELLAVVGGGNGGAGGAPLSILLDGGNGGNGGAGGSGVILGSGS